MNLSYTPSQAYDPNDPYWFLRQKQQKGDAATTPSTEENKGPNWGDVANGISTLADNRKTGGSVAGDVIGSAAAGAAAGSKLGPWGALAGAVLGAGSSAVKTITGNQKAANDYNSAANTENTARLENMRLAANNQVQQNENNAASKLAALAKMRDDAQQKYRMRSFRNLALRGA